jgi:hypothetical protein
VVHHHGVGVLATEAVALAQQVDLVLVFVAAQRRQLLEPVRDWFAVLFLDARKMRRSIAYA